MRSLFLKIFLCFWLSQTLILVATYALTQLNETQIEASLNAASAGENEADSAPRAPLPLRARTRRERILLRQRRRASILKLRRPKLTFHLLAIVLASGLVSYGLARYLTEPAARLSRATHRLAGGDLTTRVGPQMGRRRDELADLGRDFDVMAERIQALMLAERRLLADISHELRSPLARINVAVELAQQSADPETHGFLKRIERESARLNRLIGQLLTLTRVEMDDATPRAVINIAALLPEIAADADFEARSHGRSVQILPFSASDDPSEKNFSINGNAELLHSAVENVVRNAVHYTAENSAVAISLRRETRDKSQEIVIRVRDHGPGVPEAALSHLFDPFYRVAQARERQSGGVGLGLSIAARAVRFHGGEISATNVSSGGLEIEIRLPTSQTDSG